MRMCHYGFIVLGSLLSMPVWADDAVIGYVKMTSPNAYLEHNRQQELAKLGSPVTVGTIIKTDAEGALGLALKDDTLLSFGPDTEFEMTGFEYKPEIEQLQLDMCLVKGTLQYISGVIAKLKPTAVNIKTPAGIIGVRGTRFVAKVKE